MITHKKKFVTYIKITTSYFVLFLLMMIAYPYNAEDIYIKSYLLNGLFTLIILTLLISIFLRRKLNIFEPIFFISFIYTTMYFITPMIDVATQEYLWFGYNLFPYGIKASLIAFLGYLSFYVSYNFSRENKHKNIERNFEIMPTSKINVLIVIMYIICIIPTIYYITRSGGMSILYVLSLGLYGSSSAGNAIGDIGFLSMFSYSLPTVTLLYYEFGKSKVLKFIFFALMIILQISMGYRFIIVQIAIMFFAYYYLKHNKQPKFRQLLLSLVILLVPILIMTLFRDSIRDGGGMQLSSINIETIFTGLNDAILGNFRIYQNFYGMVNVIPEVYDYVYGRQIIIGTFLMIIPRIIWPTKVSSYGGEGLKELIGSNIASGQAYPNLGEYYYAFGIFGVILCMFIYGWFMKKVRIRFMRSTLNINLMIFAVLLGCNLQIIIRGYMPSNVYLILFSVLPIYFIKLYIRRDMINIKRRGI